MATKVPRINPHVTATFRGMNPEREREYVLELARRYWEECKTLHDLVVEESMSTPGQVIALFERNGVPRRQGVHAQRHRLQPQKLDDVLAREAAKQSAKVARRSRTKRAVPDKLATGR